MINFTKARAGEESYVYVCPPGGEYGWVTDPEWFDDIDEPVTVVRQQWQLICEDKVTFHPSTELCPKCHGEGQVIVEIPGYVPVYTTEGCPTCKGDGGHPFVGRMQVHP